MINLKTECLSGVICMIVTELEHNSPKPTKGHSSFKLQQIKIRRKNTSKFANFTVQPSNTPVTVTLAIRSSVITLNRCHRWVSLHTEVAH